MAPKPEYLFFLGGLQSPPPPTSWRPVKNHLPDTPQQLRHTLIAICRLGLPSWANAFLMSRLSGEMRVRLPVRSLCSRICPIFLPSVFFCRAVFVLRVTENTPLLISLCRAITFPEGKPIYILVLLFRTASFHDNIVSLSHPLCASVLSSHFPLRLFLCSLDLPSVFHFFFFFIFFFSSSPSKNPPPLSFISSHNWAHFSAWYITAWSTSQGWVEFKASSGIFITKHKGGALRLRLFVFWQVVFRREKTESTASLNWFWSFFFFS